MVLVEDGVLLRMASFNWYIDTDGFFQLMIRGKPIF